MINIDCKQAVREFRVNTRFTPTFIPKSLVGANLVFAPIAYSLLFLYSRTACKEVTVERVL